MNCFSPHSIVLVVLWFSGAIFHLLAIVMFCVIMLVLCLSYAAAAHQCGFAWGISVVLMLAQFSGLVHSVLSW